MGSYESFKGSFKAAWVLRNRSLLAIRINPADLTLGMWARSHLVGFRVRSLSFAPCWSLTTVWGMRTRRPTFCVQHQASSKAAVSGGKAGRSPGVVLSSRFSQPCFPLLGRAQGCRLPGPSSQRRLKTKLPGGCSEA